MTESCYFADGFDAAVLGLGTQFNQTVVVYDYQKCIDILAKDMSREEAEEYFEFNVIGAWVGKGTPIFVNAMTRKQIEEELHE